MMCVELPIPKIYTIQVCPLRCFGERSVSLAIWSGGIGQPANCGRSDRPV